MREAQRLNRLWANGHRARVMKALTLPDGSIDKATLAMMLDAHVAAYREILAQWQQSGN